MLPPKMLQLWSWSLHMYTNVIMLKELQSIFCTCISAYPSQTLLMTPINVALYVCIQEWFSNLHWFLLHTIASYISTQYVPLFFLYINSVLCKQIIMYFFIIIKKGILGVAQPHQCGMWLITHWILQFITVLPAIWKIPLTSLFSRNVGHT